MLAARNLFVLALIGLFIGASACSSRPRASEQETLYWNHGGKKVVRKRVEERTRTVRRYNEITNLYYDDTEHFTVVILELESPRNSSNSSATELQMVYFRHGGRHLLRKRTETRDGTAVIILVIENPDGSFDDVEVSVATGNKLSEGGRIPDLPNPEAVAVGLAGQRIDIEVSTHVANALQVGERIPDLTIEQAARAGLVGNCVEVTMVYGSSQAEGLDIRVDDLIIKYNGQNMLGTRVFNDAIAATKPADSLTIFIERDGQGIQLSAKGGDLGVQVRDQWR